MNHFSSGKTRADMPGSGGEIGKSAGGGLAWVKGGANVGFHFVSFFFERGCGISFFLVTMHIKYLKLIILYQGTLSQN